MLILTLDSQLNNGIVFSNEQAPSSYVELRIELSTAVQDMP